jgi:hypothetical protein
VLQHLHRLLKQYHHHRRHLHRLLHSPDFLRKIAPGYAAQFAVMNKQSELVDMVIL